MSDQVNKDQTQAAKQEEITELSDDQLDEVAGGSGARLSVEPEDLDSAAEQPQQPIQMAPIYVTGSRPL